MNIVLLILTFANEIFLSQRDCQLIKAQFHPWLPSTCILLLTVLRGCGNPGRPSYAVVSGKSYWVGSIVRYFCNPGYTLIGRGARRCMSSGYWSGRTPQCKYQKRILKTKNFNFFIAKLGSSSIHRDSPVMFAKKESDFCFPISQSKTK